MVLSWSSCPLIPFPNKSSMKRSFILSLYHVLHCDFLPPLLLCPNFFLLISSVLFFLISENILKSTVHQVLSKWFKNNWTFIIRLWSSPEPCKAGKKGGYTEVGRVQGRGESAGSHFVCLSTTERTLLCLEQLTWELLSYLLSILQLSLSKKNCGWSNITSALYQSCVMLKNHICNWTNYC
jgi:hypothetical protein